MESLSDKYILTDEWGRPILKGVCEHAECPECLTIFLKRIHLHRFCCKKCARNCWDRENRQKKIKVTELAEIKFNHVKTCIPNWD